MPLPRNFIGEKRLAHMAAAAILEAIDDYPDARATAALILCLAEEDRPGRLAPDASRLAARIAEITGLASPHRTRIVAHGRPSGIVALDQARRLLADRHLPLRDDLRRRQLPDDPARSPTTSPSAASSPPTTPTASSPAKPPPPSSAPARAPAAPSA